MTDLEKDIEKKHIALTVLQEAYKKCDKCALADSRKHVVFGIGNPNADILIVGEAPGEIEDMTGFPLVGPSGQILDYLLAKAYKDDKFKKVIKSFPKNIDKYGWTWKDFTEAKQLLMENVFYTNTVLCRPPENRNPSNPEIKACNERLLETIYVVDPIIVIAAGKIAFETLMGKKVASIQKLCGRLVDVTVIGRMTNMVYPIMPILHPAHLARNPDLGKKEGLWESTLRHLRTVIEIVQKYNEIS